MHRLDFVHPRGHFDRRERCGVGVTARAALAACVAVASLLPSPSALACGYHDPASAGIGMLNWAYPDSLHVRTAVWMAQAGGQLPAREPLPVGDPLSGTVRFQQSLRLRETQARLDELRNRVEASTAGEPMPAFAVVLIGPMLWTRFDNSNGSVEMASHASGPTRDDVVLVTDEAVVAALTDRSITAREARAQGLIKAYGNPERVESLSALLDRSF